MVQDHATFNGYPKTSLKIDSWGNLPSKLFREKRGNAGYVSSALILWRALFVFPCFEFFTIFAKYRVFWSFYSTFGGASFSRGSKNLPTLSQEECQIEPCFLCKGLRNRGDVLTMRENEFSASIRNMFNGALKIE
jgi:hypothetical protein